MNNFAYLIIVLVTNILLNREGIAVSVDREFESGE